MLSRYTPFVKNAFLGMLAYRLRYYTGIFTYIVFIAVHYFVWQAIYKDRGVNASIGGYSLNEMLTYITVGWVARSLYFSDIDEDIDEQVRSGQIGVSLLRPVDFQLMMLSQAFGASLFRASCFALPLGIVVSLLFPVFAPSSWISFFLFALSTFLGFLVFAELNFIVGLLAFSLKSIQGIVRAKYFIVQLFSGLLLPIALFPNWLRQVLHYLPFEAIASTPLQCYLGKLAGVELLLALLKQIFWVVFLMMLGRYCWKLAWRKLTVQGG